MTKANPAIFVSSHFVVQYDFLDIFFVKRNKSERNKKLYFFYLKVIELRHRAVQLGLATN